MARALIFTALLLGAFATKAASQVRVDARLDKDTYLKHEPVTVVVDILNAGDEAFAYSTCDGRVTLTVSGVERRVAPDIMGCYSGMGGSTGSAGCAIDHPPMLAPGERTSFRYLLREYDLAPGQYRLTASGKAGVRWKYYPWSMATPNAAPPPPPKHKESDPVPGAQFERSFALRIAAATEDELKRAFAPLVAAADVKLPDEVADGDATVRVGRTRDGVDSFGAPLTFVITSGPLPLGGVALGMTPIAPGQWSDLLTDHLVEYALRRADRVEVEFKQGDVAVIGRPTGPDRVHVQVPTAMKPGPVSVRNRTWIEQTASEWSAPVEYRVLARRVLPSINSIEAGPVRSLVWWSGDAALAFVAARPGDALVLRGHFPDQNRNTSPACALTMTGSKRTGSSPSSRSSTMGGASATLKRSSYSRK